MNVTMTGLTQHGSFAEARCLHIAGQPCMFHFGNLADVMNFARKIGSATTFAFASIEAFH
jgi:hypothetical protein